MIQDGIMFYEGRAATRNELGTLKRRPLFSTIHLIISIICVAVTRRESFHYAAT
jgi:hypothetical protein